MTRFQAAVGEIHDFIGPTLVALASGNSDRDIADKWINGERYPTDEDERRIYFILNRLREISESEGVDVARAWFIGANCDNMTRSPAELIREGRLREVEISAKQLMSGGLS